MSRPRLYTRAFVFATLAALMLNLAAFLFVHLPGFLQQLGAGEAEIGRIMSAQAVGAIAAWPLVGWALDVYGRRVLVLGGCALFVAVIALYLAVDSLGPFVYIVRVLDGFVATAWFVALFTHAADLVPAQRRTEGLAIFGASALMPIGLGAQFGDLILAWAGYRELFLGALGCAAAGLLLSLPLRDVPLVHGDETAAPRRGLLISAAQPNLIPVWVAAFAFFLSSGALFTFLKTFVVATGIGSVGSFLSAYALIAVSLRLFLGWLPQRLGVRRMVGLALGSYAAGFVVLASAQTPAHVIAAGLLCGAGHGYAYPVLFGLVVERAGSRRRGSASAFYTAIDWFALLLAGPLFGYAIERAGYGAAFVGAALALGGGVALFYGLDRRLRRRATLAREERSA